MNGGMTVLRESQRDSATKPRVASPRATLGNTNERGTTLKGLCQNARVWKTGDATPLVLNKAHRGRRAIFNFQFSIFNSQFRPPPKFGIHPSGCRVPPNTLK